MADTNTRQGKRTPVTLKIKFKSETLEQFIERYAVDVSQGGIFIRTKEPLAVGTQMKFEFQLRDASPLIAGEGTVVWTRENDPSRPAIAPGMGVRFDRLADGSQTVLEKILAEKAKQAPPRSGSVTAPGDAAKAAAAFTDTPTRVAPASVVQEALGSGDQTPLPKPTPFHSDAEDFDEKAFEEATKVRSLDELAAQSAALEAALDGPGNQTKVMPADELASRRQAGRADSTLSDPPLAAPPDDDEAEDEDYEPTKPAPDRESAPVLPSPPAVNRARTPTPSGAAPAPARATSPSIAPPVDGAIAKTQLGIEPAKAQTSSPRIAPPSDSAAPRAVPAEPSRPVAPSRPSSAPIVIGVVVIVAAALAAGWYFFLRTDTTKKSETVPSTGSAVVTPTTGTGSAVEPPPNTGSATPATGSGSASADVATTGSGSATEPAGPVADTTVTATAKGATVEILGTSAKGNAPFTTKLEKGKAFRARVTAPGYATSEVDVKGGEKTSVNLAKKPHVIAVSSEPAGSAILVDGVDTGKVTPASIELTAAQLARPRVRITIRHAGFRPFDQTLDAAAYTESDATMNATVDGKLVQAAVVRPPPTNTGGTTAPTNTNTGTGSASAGSASTPAGTGSATTTPATTPPTTTPTGTGSASGGGAGSTTPTPTPTPTPAPAPSSGSGGMSSELK